MDLKVFNTFEPVKFLRAHSRNKDNADVQTQVWSCAFEPEDDVNKFYSGAHTFATCGGNSVCFIDCITGTVLAKYYAKDSSISFFSLAWTTVRDRNTRRSVLAAGTSKSSLFVFDSVKKLCVLEHKFRSKRTVCINALYFHQTEKQVLFCGFSDGVIRLCELRRDENESYFIKENNCILNNEEIFDLTYSLTTRLLLVSRSNGLHCFHYPSKESLITSSVNESHRFGVTSIQRESDNDLVDSVEVLTDGLFACKYVLHGCIYICDSKQLRSAIDSKKKCEFVEIEALKTLKWSNTDNYYMYMGVSAESQVLCCGDDKGSLWLYDLSLIGKYSWDSVPPTAIIPWPELADHYNDKKRKLELDVYDIVIDKVAIHCSGNYIVAVTNNNLVCIWGRSLAS